MATEQPPNQQTQAKQAHSIKPVTTPDDLTSTIALFQEYAASLNTDLSFQSFSSELASLPGKYSPPAGGALLLARTSAGQPIGCVALRSLGHDDDDDAGETSTSTCCELKRLYVSSAGRGTGLGRALTLAALEQARGMGYRRARLDTLRSMTSAMALYEKLGFVEIEAYYHNPLEGTCYLELNLEGSWQNQLP